MIEKYTGHVQVKDVVLCVHIIYIFATDNRIYTSNDVMVLGQGECLVHLRAK